MNRLLTVCHRNSFETTKVNDNFYQFYQNLFVLDEMNGSDSDCESLDSGLETGNSNLETSENGFVTIEGDTDTVSDDENDKLEREESNLSDFR